MSDKKDIEDLGKLPNGAHMFREPDGAGGFAYWSDEISGGVKVWVTSLINESTLLSAIHFEHARKCDKFIAKSKKETEITPEMQMEQCAATGGTFLPKEVVKSLQEDKGLQESYARKKRQERFKK